jgi:hypothetical protein
MKKRVKKPSVKPELRQEWLKRYESGETPPKIADSDDFDVRTIRKHIDLAKQERDMREARSAVLRDALEQHYHDMYDLAREMDSAVASRGYVVLDSEMDRRILALRQHIPRSTLWTNSTKWNRTLDEIASLNEIMEEKLGTDLKRSRKLNSLPEHVKEDTIKGLTDALSFQFKAWSQGRPGLNRDTDIHTEKAADAMYNIRYGAFHTGPIDNENLDNYRQTILEVIEGHEAKMKKWDHYIEVLKSYNTLNTLQKRLRDELAIVIMRRVVPGKCKYCPL